MDVSAGSRLGPYEILARIGAGGMGEVFRARDTRLDRTVAIKVLPAEFADNAQFRIRFEHEAKTISQLDHPNICRLHDIGEVSGTSYLVMELLEGETLADRIARGPLPLSEVFRFGSQIAEALDRAHRSGILHRDLKPANVMLTRSGAKLLDFGLAKTSTIDAGEDGATQHKPLTKEGTILGTFQYMAPEQLEGLEADPRTDIFALGALLYEMATGKRAFDGATKTSLIAAIVSQDPKPIAQMQPLTPPAFEHVVERCLAKRADDRWQSAHDVAEQLRWISEVGSQAGVAAPLVARKRSRERLAWSLAAALALALLATGWLYSKALRKASETAVFDISEPEGTRFNAVGDESGAAVVSPDGTMVVYSVAAEANTQLWLRTIATGEAKPLGGTEGGAFPFWSPDSRHIGFFALGSMKRVDVSGGAPVTIVQAPAARGGSWSKDGTIIFTPDTQNAIVRVRSTGGEAVPITVIEPSTHSTHRWPWFLPDGKHFLYLAANHQAPTGGENGIYIGSTEGGTPRLLLKATSNAIYASGYLLFARDQVLMAQRMSESGVLEGEPAVIANNALNDGGIWRGAVSASETGLLVYHTGRVAALSTLRWLDRSGKDLGVVAEPASYWDIELSPKGDKIAVSLGDPQREIWILDHMRGTRTRFPLNQAWAGTAVFSPDGSTIYFDVASNSRGTIRARRVSGGGDTELAETVQYPLVRSVSPDGKYLLAENRQAKILRYLIQPKSTPEVLTQGAAIEAAPEYSPDGKLIAFQSSQNGQFQIFVMSSADPTQKWQISAAGGTMPRWNRDGREILYLDLVNRITSVAIEHTGEDVTVGQTKTLFTITPRPQARPFAVTPDGQRFLVNTMTELQSPNAVAVSNWTERLKK